MSLPKFEMSVMLGDMIKQLKSIDTSDMNQFGDGCELNKLADTVLEIQHKFKESSIPLLAQAVALMPPPPPPKPPIITRFKNGFEDKVIHYNGKLMVVGAPLTKQSHNGNNVVGCNEFLCNGSCKRVTFVSKHTLEELFSGATNGRKKFANALLKTRRFCPTWIETHNLYNPDKKVTQPTPEELHSMAADFNNEVSQEKLRRGEWCVTLTDAAPIGLRLKFDYDEGLLTAVSVENTDKLPVLIEGGQMINIVEENVLLGSKLLTVDGNGVVGATKESIMSLLRYKRPLTLAFQIKAENVPSTILKNSGHPEGGVDSRIWSLQPANRQLALLTVAAGTADETETAKKQRVV